MATALKSWELENAVELLDPTRDALYNFNLEKQKAFNDAKSWKTNPSHFKKVRISAVALLKMVMHARSGGSIEVMGLMQGSVEGDTFVVTDAFRLPVEGTETRVNAQDEANEYLIEYLSRCRDNDQQENVIGWYHSHPGYGCWLSGIDVNTEAMQQQFGDPFCAIVIDPDRTISAGKVEIGAFRTYPPDHKPESATDSDGFQTIPMDKANDFGAHADKYYSLEVSHFKSSLDTKLLESLWNKYWIGTLSASPLLQNRDFGTRQIKDLAYKINDAAATQNTSKHGNASWVVGISKGGGFTNPDAKLDKIVKASEKIAAEERAGLIAADIKGNVFSCRTEAPVGAGVSSA